MINDTLSPNTKKSELVTISKADSTPVDLSALPFVDIELAGAYRVNNLDYQLPARKRLTLEWQHILPEIPNAKKIASDQFENFDSAGFTSVTTPELQNVWYWYGINDCLIKFRLIRDSKYLYVTAFITDDQLVLENHQDVLYLNFEDRNGATAKCSIQPMLKNAVVTVDGKTVLDAKDIQLKSMIDPNGQLRFLIQLPLDKIMKADRSVRFNIGYRDQDLKPDVENSTLFWKPVWGTSGDYKNSGTYLIK
jgi:hypothetical protein